MELINGLDFFAMDAPYVSGFHNKISMKPSLPLATVGLRTIAGFSVDEYTFSYFQCKRFSEKGFSSDFVCISIH